MNGGKTGLPDEAGKNIGCLWEPFVLFGIPN